MSSGYTDGLQRVIAQLDDSTDDKRPTRPSVDQPMPTSPIGMTVYPLKLEGKAEQLQPNLIFT